MISAEWSAVLDSLRKRHQAGALTFFNDSAIANFVQSLPQRDRIPVLLTAYSRYRELGPAPSEYCSEHYLESSAHSILISQILSDPLDAAEEDVCTILHSSVHFLRAWERRNSCRAPNIGSPKISELEQQKHGEQGAESCRWGRAAGELLNGLLMDIVGRFVFAAALFGVGAVCLLWPRSIQAFAVRSTRSEDRKAVFQSDSYLVMVRIIGVVPLAMSGLMIWMTFLAPQQ
jgi:hypothetical protein